MKKNKIKFPPILIVIAIIVMVLIFAIGYAYKTVSNSNYFNIKEVVANNVNGLDLSYLKGKNIIDLNLVRESRKILLEPISRVQM